MRNSAGQGGKMNDRPVCNLKALINALNSSNGTVHSDAARALSSLVKTGVFDEASLKLLIGLLFDSNKHVRHNSWDVC
jgi:HEAT repeat protein